MAISSADAPASPGCFKALWMGLVQFFGTLFKRSPSKSELPLPATARSPATEIVRSDATSRTGSASVPRRGVGPSPAGLLQHGATTSTASPRSRQITSESKMLEFRPCSPIMILSPPPSPLPTISLSDVPTSPACPTPFPVSGVLAADVDHPLPDSGLPELVLNGPSPCCDPQRSNSSPRCFRGKSAPTHNAPSITIHAECTAISATVKSTYGEVAVGDGNSQILPSISNFERLRSPWSPPRGNTSPDVWMTSHGTVTTSSGPAVKNGPALDSKDVSTVDLSFLDTLVTADSKFIDEPPRPWKDEVDCLTLSNLDHLVRGLASDPLQSTGATASPVGSVVEAENRSNIHDGSLTLLARPIETTPTPDRKQLHRHTTPIRKSAMKRLSTPLSDSIKVNRNHRLYTPKADPSSPSELWLKKGGGMVPIEQIISLLDQTPERATMQLSEVICEDTIVIPTVEAL